ncbi:MAG: hypothetical protein KIT41_14300 [Pyrinomonadaceae bacterium]|nr:hypothetical protein [Pyrinomonadaceae bacterium]
MNEIYFKFYSVTLVTVVLLFVGREWLRARRARETALGREIGMNRLLRLAEVWLERLGEFMSPETRERSRWVTYLSVPGGELRRMTTDRGLPRRGDLIRTIVNDQQVELKVTEIEWVIDETGRACGAIVDTEDVEPKSETV